MIAYLTHDKIDRLKWDDCISQSFNGLIYAYTWYLDIVCPNWEALVENDYERVFPLTAKKKSGINYLYQPFFTQQLGVFSKNILTEEKTGEFLDCIPKKYKLTEINLNVFNKVSGKKHRVSANKNFELDLIPSYEQIFRKYSTNAKRNLKTAEKSQLTISRNADLLKVISLFREHRGKDIETLKDDDYEMFVRLMNALHERRLVHIWGVTSPQEELCAGAIFIESNKRVIFIFSATGPVARKNGAMTFLIDRFICDNAQRNLILDFEGSNDPDLARFYKGFGSTECIYHHYKKNTLPLILSKSVTFIKWFKKQV